MLVALVEEAGEAEPVRVRRRLPVASECPLLQQHRRRELPHQRRGRGSVVERPVRQEPANVLDAGQSEPRGPLVQCRQNVAGNVADQQVTHQGPHQLISDDIAHSSTCLRGVTKERRSLRIPGEVPLLSCGEGFDLPGGPHRNPFERANIDHQTHRCQHVD